MASLTGTSCVWRRSCIEAIGGISTATITEDVDMGYAAQLENWKYVWLRDVTSKAEFPESMAAFRVQRQRWARGLIQNAARHVRQMFATSMPLLARLYALSLMFSSLLLAAFFLRPAALPACGPAVPAWSFFPRLLYPLSGSSYHLGLVQYSQRQPRSFLYPASRQCLRLCHHALSPFPLLLQCCRPSSRRDRRLVPSDSQGLWPPEDTPSCHQQTARLAGSIFSVLWACLFQCRTMGRELLDIPLQRPCLLRFFPHAILFVE